jgi:hypothetical protein
MGPARNELLLGMFCAANGTSYDWRKSAKMLFSGIMAACTVSFVDLDGIRHSVEVDAEGLYEASVLGLAAFRKHDLEPGGLTQLEVEVRSSVKHTLTVTKVRDWLQRGVRTPKEAVLKDRLRALLSS